MKIICPQKETLEKMIGYAEKITSKNSTLPVLKCLYLESKKNELVIKATNLDLGIEIKLPVKTEKEGIVTVPGNILSGFISNIKDEKTITLEEVDGNLKVSTSHHSTIIKCQPSEDFPSIPHIEDGKTVILNAKSFIKGLKAVWYSASVSSMKP